ncbi:unnamed protein product, partial [Ectocarpus sp. 12 AP-2014]
SSRKDCTSRVIAPGEERDAILEAPSGKTVSDYAVLKYQRVTGPDRLPIYKPPYSRITAIDMNTGEHLWWIPVGETPQSILDHPVLSKMDMPNTGTGRTPPMAVTPDMLMYASTSSDGTPYLFAVDKATGKELARVEVPASSYYGMMTYVHEGKQFVMLQTGSTLTAVALGEDIETD